MEYRKGDVSSSDKTVAFVSPVADSNTTVSYDSTKIAISYEKNDRQATKEHVASKDIKAYLQFLLAAVYWKKFTLEQANECMAIWMKKFSQENFFQFLLSKKVFSPESLGALREKQSEVPEGIFEVFIKDGIPCIQGIQGKKFGKYILEHELGRGGMGIVYKGYDPSSQKIVAIKRLTYEAKSQDAMVQRFLREASTLQKLSHPNIVPVYEIGWEEEKPYYVMGFIKGKGLDQFSLPLSYRKACKILIPVAEALHYAHQNSIIHRDIKPSNIIIDDEERPWLTDFGLAKDMSANQNLTEPGSILGTPFYMSPEQVACASNVDFRCDIYSLGAVLYQLLSGNLPFAEKTLGLLFHQIINEEPVLLTEYQLKLPSSMVSICQKAMAKKPEDRYRSASLMAKDLRNAMRNTKTSQYREKSKIYKKIGKPSLFIGVFLFLTLFCIFLFQYGPGDLYVTVKKKGLSALEVINQESKTQNTETELEKEEKLSSKDLKRVKSYIKNKEFGKALSFINRLLSQDTKNADCYSLRAEVYLYMSEPSIGLQDIEKAIFLEPRVHDYYRIKAEILRNMKRYQEALAAYSNAISLEECPFSYLGRGALYSNHLGEHQKAIQDFEKVLHIEPGKPVAYYNMGVAYSRLKNYPKSVESYGNAIQNNRNYFEAYLARGIIYCDVLKEYEKALEDFNWAISLDPKCYDAYCNRAITLAHMQNYTEAVETCKFAIGLNADLSKAYYLRACNNYRLKNEEAALADFEKALEKNSPYQDEIQGWIKKIKEKK